LEITLMLRYSARVKPMWLLPIIVITVMVLFIVGRLVLPHAAPPPPSPPALVVCECRGIAPGMRRIRAGVDIWFYIPEKGFTYNSGMGGPTDSLLPPVQTVTARNGSVSELQISAGAIPIERDLQFAWPVFSKHIEQRVVHYSYGSVVSMERWGYLKTGDRWRYVKFAGGGEAGYLPTHEKNAQLFDQIINSACFQAAGP